jgi:hypothetical protein
MRLRAPSMVASGPSDFAAFGAAGLPDHASLPCGET